MTIRPSTAVPVIAGLLMIATVACDSAPSGSAPTREHGTRRTTWSYKRVDPAGPLFRRIWIHWR